MLNEQSTKIISLIKGSLETVEQGRSNIEHFHYAIYGREGERTIHVIIFRTPPYEEEDEQNEDEEQH